MNKVLVVSLLAISSLSISACGNNGTSGYTQVPIRMTTVSVDPVANAANCCCDTATTATTRPTVKLQGPIEEDAPVTPVLTPAKSTLTTKTNTTTTPAKKDELNLGDSLPEVKAPPATDNKTSTQQPEEKKTKLGQLVDKVKNLFKKKS